MGSNIERECAMNEIRATLKLYVNPENKELFELYKTHIENHNKSISSSTFPNAGFDLFMPNDVSFDAGFITTMVDLEIKTEMVYCNGSTRNSDNCGYYVFPRSSMSKTPLMLANHTGIIDSGYRGNLIGAFRSFSPNVFSLDKHTRVLQICHPSLCKIHVILVDNVEELSTTARGSGGFGSTGVKGTTV